MRVCGLNHVFDFIDEKTILRAKPLLVVDDLLGTTSTLSVMVRLLDEKIRVLSRFSTCNFVASTNEAHPF